MKFRNFLLVIYIYIYRNFFVESLYWYFCLDEYVYRNFESGCEILCMEFDLFRNRFRVFLKKKNTKSKKLLIIKQNSEQERASLFFSFFLFLLFFPIMRKKIVLWIILIYEIQANNKSKIISFFGLLTENTLWK